MRALLTAGRLGRLASFAGTQAGVQALAFLAGILLVRDLSTTDYGYYTLGVTLVSVAGVVTELGVATSVLSIGGRWLGDTPALGALVADARGLHNAMAAIGLAVLLPCFAWLLLHQHASFRLVSALCALGAATVVLNVRSAIALSVVRLRGALRTQQRVDLGLNALRLAVMAAASLWWLDAVVASFVNLMLATGVFLAWRGWLRRHAIVAAEPAGRFRGELRRSVLRQAPNSLYYVVNSQLVVWLVALFGTAERVADVGALGRLGVAFAVVASVMGAMIQPYFARNHEASDLEAGFVAVNLFFAATAAALAGAALAVPGALLWVLGPRYASLHAELPWMVLGSTLTAWAGALYTIGCGRGWVVPGRVAIGCGLAATLAGLWCFDVSTVSGNFKLGALTGAVATLVNLAYVGQCLVRHRRGAVGGRLETRET